MCTPGSLVPTRELSWHSLIEFGNRTMTGVLGLVAIAVLVLLWRWRKQRRDLFTLAWVVLAGIIFQGVVGGVTVWTGLNSFIVGFHYVATLVLVCITTVFLVRYYDPAEPRVRAVPKYFAILTHVTTLVFAISVVIGVLTTGAGPHSGDDTVIREGVDAALLAHFHAWPGYAVMGLVVVLTLIALYTGLRPRNQLLYLVIMLVVQIAFGIYQARNGLPALSVGVHMVLAGLASANMTWVVMRLKKPVSQ
jgi:cytochrome c oxidase assembly protein subunit 15